MKILLAFDSFKESMSSLEAAQCFQEGFSHVYPDAKMVTKLLSDGGEGFVDALIYGQGQIVTQEVCGPLGDPISASFGFLSQDNTAAIEMATASGLELVPKKKRNPLKTTTFGTGQLIKAALENSGQFIYIGIGGSATNDGGMGMAQALGAEFFDKDGKLLKKPLRGKDLSKISRISTKNLMPEIQDTRFMVACDVNNPFIGPNGASAVFGPQKGATPKMVKELEKGMKSLAKVIKRDLGVDVAQMPGAGAAGGIGGMLHALLKATMSSGIDLVMDSIDFEEEVKDTDLIVTGEGRIDSQTVGGKTISGIVGVAKRHGVPVLAIGGSISEKDMPALVEGGIHTTLSLVSSPMELSDAIKNGPQLMRQTGTRAARLLQSFARVTIKII